MRVGVGVRSSSLEILSADQTGINVYPGQRNGTQLLEIEVQQIAVDRVEIWTETMFPVEHGR